MAEWRAALAAAMEMSPNRSGRLNFPWEIGPYAGFFKDANDWTKHWDGPVGTALDVKDKVRAADEGGADSHLPAKRPRLGMRTSEVDAVKAPVIMKWMAFLDGMPEESNLEFIFAGIASHGERGVVIGDIFAGKSAATLRKRLQSLMRFRKEASPGSLLTSEEDVYRYVTTLSGTAGTGATASSSFLQGLRLLSGCFEVDATKVLVSRRVLGSAKNLLLMKKPTRQRDPLTADQLIILEQAARDSLDDQEKIWAGGLCFMVYARLRGSDSMRVSGIDIDIIEEEGHENGFVEANALATKGATTTARKTQFLPVVAPVPGVGDGNWASIWMAERREQGLGGTAPILPLPASDGTWTDRPMCTADVGRILRYLLASHRVLYPDRNTGCHSLKPTMLSWCAKAGVSNDHRRALGYHTSKSDSSINIYSRDAVAPALASLRKVIDDVKAKKFMPDATRSGRFAGGLAEPDVDDVEEEVSSEASSDATSDESDSDSTPEDDEAPTYVAAASSSSASASTCTFPPEPPAATIGSTTAALEEVDEAFNGGLDVEVGGIYFHKKYKTMHVAKDTDAFICGSVISKVYISTEGGGHGFSPQCRRCFRRQKDAATAP